MDLNRPFISVYFFIFKMCFLKLETYFNSTALLTSSALVQIWAVQAELENDNVGVAAT